MTSKHRKKKLKKNKQTDDAAGSAGLVLNAPSRGLIGDVGLDQALAGSFSAQPLYCGGPVAQNSLHLLHGKRVLSFSFFFFFLFLEVKERKKETHNSPTTKNPKTNLGAPGLEGAHEVIGGVYAGGLPSANALVSQGGASAGAFRLLSGYASWEPGQLAAEAERGAWHVVAASTAVVLDAVQGEAFFSFFFFFFFCLLFFLMFLSPSSSSKKKKNLFKKTSKAASATRTARGKRSAPGPRSWPLPASSSRPGSEASTRSSRRTGARLLVLRAATRRGEEGGRRGPRPLTERNLCTLPPYSLSPQQPTINSFLIFVLSKTTTAKTPARKKEEKKKTSSILSPPRFNALPPRSTLPPPLLAKKKTPFVPPFFFRLDDCLFSVEIVSFRAFGEGSFYFCKNEKEKNTAEKKKKSLSSLYLSSKITSPRSPERSRPLLGRLSAP